MTAAQLIERAKACVTCGKEHKPQPRGKGWAPSWASPADGHPYRPRVQRPVVDELERIAAEP